MGDIKYKTTIKKNGVNMILEARKGKNDIKMFYLEAKRNAPEGSPPQEANINCQKKRKFKMTKTKREIGTRSYSYCKK